MPNRPELTSGYGLIGIYTPMKRLTDGKEITEIVESMLIAAGFSPELYIIRSAGDSVIVHFDDRGAVDFFVEDVELYSQHVQDFIIQKGREGKRHTVTFQLW
jgi:hypothetical protein